MADYNYNIVTPPRNFTGHVRKFDMRVAYCFVCWVTNKHSHGKIYHAIQACHVNSQYANYSIFGFCRPEGMGSYSCNREGIRGSYPSHIMKNSTKCCINRIITCLSPVRAEGKFNQLKFAKLSVLYPPLSWNTPQIKWDFLSVFDINAVTYCLKCMVKVRF